MLSQEEGLRRKVKDRRIQRAMDLIRANLKSKLRVKELAEQVFMSRKHFERVFRTETGMTPKEYIVGVRIETATEPLVKSDLTIEQIAEQVGYDDPRRFRKDFKKHTGFLPGEYRKTVRSSEMP